MCIPRGGVHAESEKPDHAQCEPVSPITAFSLGDLYCFHALFRVSVQPIRRAADRFRRFAYAGCFHAGPVTRIFGRSFGGSKYSFNCVRGVVEKFLLALSGDGIRTWQAPQVLKRGNRGP